MAGNSKVKVFDHVWFNDGGPDQIGHIAKPEHDIGNGELKAVIQVPGGGHILCGYREPKDRDEGGSGRTFWLG